MPELRSVAATRYVTPLREGGSLPGLVEADDDGLYVLKFRGAGQGSKALVAEVIAGELARARSASPVPEIVLIEVDPALGAAEPDPEIQDLINGQRRASTSASTSCPARCPTPRRRGSSRRPETAAEIVWLDALVTNVDRTPRNPNLLVWHERAVADRPRRGAVLPPPRLGPGGRRGQAVPGDRRARAAAVRGLDR